MSVISYFIGAVVVTSVLLASTGTMGATVGVPGSIQFRSPGTDALVITSGSFPRMDQTACLSGWFYFPSPSTGFAHTLMSIMATDGTNMLQIGSQIVGFGNGPYESCDLSAVSIPTGWVFLSTEWNGPDTAFGRTDLTLALNGQVICILAADASVYAMVVQKSISSIIVSGGGMANVQFAGLKWTPYSSAYSYGGSDRAAIMDAQNTDFYFAIPSVPNLPFTNTTNLVTGSTGYGFTVAATSNTNSLLFVPSACSPSRCLNGGVCYGRWGGFYCICPFGTEGTECEMPFTVSSCTSGTTCMNGGMNCTQYTSPSSLKKHCDCPSPATQDSTRLCSSPGGGGGGVSAQSSSSPPATSGAASTISSAALVCIVMLFAAGRYCIEI
jgi:hypothetical protein